MSSPDGTNNHLFTFKMAEKSGGPARRVQLNNTTFVTVPANMTQPMRPVLLHSAVAVPLSPQTYPAYQIVVPAAASASQQIRLQHHKLNSAGQIIYPRSSATVVSQPRHQLTRRPLKLGAKVLCSNCGIQSSDPDTCDSCKKAIKKNGISTTSNRQSLTQAIEEGIHATKEEIERNSHKGISTSSFYNGGEETDFSRYLRSSAPKVASTRLQRKRPNLTRNTSTHDNVCITISSDSEDETDTTAVSVSTSEAPPTLKIHDESKEDAETPRKKARQDDTPVASTTKAVKIHPVQVAECVSPQPLSVKSDEELSNATLNLKIDSIRIGQLKLKPTSVLRLSHASLTMTAKCSITENDRIVTVNWTNVSGCELCRDEREPCLYMSINHGSLPTLREQLEMEKGKFPYYDPSGSADGRFFIFYINRSSITPNHLETLIKKIDLIRRKIKKPSTFLRLINFEESNQRQTLAAAVVEQGEMQDIEKRPSIRPSSYSNPQPKDAEVTERRVVTRNQSKETVDDLKFMFSGPRVELFVFPPPPIKGGISVTNEDQFCLNDGEFLNDVIIEFYLKYVYNKVLSEDNRRRSHIFSCFFYERLMQKSKKLKDVCQAERRHGQVKKWTRNVDIFSKDFIFVPINEASHWYLAVICFPGMDGERVEMIKPEGTETSLQKEGGKSEDAGGDGTSHSFAQGNEDQSRIDKNPSAGNVGGKNQPKVDEADVVESVRKCEGEQFSNDQPSLDAPSDKGKLIMVNIPNFTIRRKKPKTVKGDAACEEEIPTDSKEVVEQGSSKPVDTLVCENELTEQNGPSDHQPHSPTLQRNDRYEFQGVTSRGSSDNISTVTSSVDKNSSSDWGVKQESKHSENIAKNDTSQVESPHRHEHALGGSLVDQFVSNGPDSKHERTTPDQNTLPSCDISCETENIEIVRASPHSGVNEMKIGSGETDILISESPSINALEHRSSDLNFQGEVKVASESDNLPSNLLEICNRTSSASASCSPQLCKIENTTLELFVSPGSPAFTLPKELEQKCSVSPCRKPEIRVNKLPFESPVKVKCLYLSAASGTPIRIGTSSTSSEDSVIVLSSPEHSDVRSPQKSGGMLKNLKLLHNAVASHSFSTTNVDTPETPVTLRFQTSSHELSGCDVIMADTCQDKGDKVASEPHVENQVVQPGQDGGESKSLDGTHANGEMIPSQNAPSDLLVSNTVSTVDIIAGDYETDQTPHPAEKDAYCSNDRLPVQAKRESLTTKSSAEASIGSNIHASSVISSRGTVTSSVPGLETKNESPIREKASQKHSEVSSGDLSESATLSGDRVENACSLSVKVPPALVTETSEIAPSLSNGGDNASCGRKRKEKPVHSEENLESTSPVCGSNGDADEEASDRKPQETEQNPQQGIKVYKKPCILIFDSLRGPSRSKIAASLREYLTMEWKTRKRSTHGDKLFNKDTLKMCSVSVPQQDNYTDCGLFLLHYVEKFFSNPITSFHLPIKLEKWFDPEECKEKRSSIKNVIEQLQKDWLSNESDS